MSTAFQLNTFALLLFFVSKTQAVLLKTLEHGVEGDVKIEGDTIVVENFSFDGTAPAAFFYVGTSGCPSGAGIQLGEKPLREHSGQKHPLKLPNDIRAGDVTWVAVWCRKASVDFGHAFLSPTEELNCSSGSSGNGTWGSESRSGFLALVVLVSLVALGAI